AVPWYLQWLAAKKLFCCYVPKAFRYGKNDVVRNNNVQAVSVQSTPEHALMKNLIPNEVNFTEVNTDAPLHGEVLLEAPSRRHIVFSFDFSNRLKRSINCRYKRRESKPIEALLGAATPLLAGVTTIGLVSATGLAFQSIVVSTLFLVLAIGIDDVFIMLAAWHRTEKSLDIPQRIAEMVEVSGCSMTVTSITNLISFGNGVLSSTPVLQTFAIYSVVASVICYLYQLILFPAILTLTAHNEYKKIDDNECGPTCLPEELTPIKHAGIFHDKAWRCLARVVGKPWMRTLTILVLIVYWCITYYGISIVETDLSVQKLAPPEARIVKFKIRYDQAIKNMQTFAVIVTTPGDLRDENRLRAIKNMIKDYETASYRVHTQLSPGLSPIYGGNTIVPLLTNDCSRHTYAEAFIIP
ncbi:patched family protein, partial [Oesophagostomum dentatum]